MRATIDVANRREATLLREGLSDPEVRTFVKLMGILLKLQTDRERARVLHWVSDKLAEYAEVENSHE